MINSNIHLPNYCCGYRGEARAEGELHFLRKYLRHSEGATAVEYGLIIGIIGGALILGIGAFSDKLGEIFQTIADSILVKF